MMFDKILSVSQLKAADAYTIAHEPISSLHLMERAAGECYKYLRKLYPEGHRHFHVFCGMGNNGGDGLALARMLCSNDTHNHVSVYLLRYGNVPSLDVDTNLHKLKSCSDIVLREYDHCPPKGFPIQNGDVIIDALFGSGLNRPLQGLVAEVVSKLNTYKGVKRIAIDVPSGLFCDHITPPESVIFQADLTLTFHSLKKSFLFPENARCVGKVVVLDIALHKDFIQTANTDDCLLNDSLLSFLNQERDPFAHKGMFGHAMLICGSYSKMGAAVLSAKAALRSGVGLLTVHVPRCGVEILQTAVPEAMLSVNTGKDFCQLPLPDIARHTAIGIGCGWGQETHSAEFLRELLKKNHQPMVLDADALNILAQFPDFQELIPENSILTPHLKEFERLWGMPAKHHEERLKQQKEWSRRHKVIIVLKGAYTCITSPQGISYFNTTGNPGMATAGSGDVLTGVITGLLAQKFPPMLAAFGGVYLHGRAGDDAKRLHGERALIASDIIQALACNETILR